MRLLAISGGDVGVTELARQLDINSAAVTRQLHELADERLIRRRTDSKDGRRSYVKLSSKGRRLFEKIQGRSHDLERSLVSVLGVVEMQNAAMVLMKLRTFVESAR